MCPARNLYFRKQRLIVAYKINKRVKTSNYTIQTSDQPKIVTCSKVIGTTPIS